MSRKNKNKKFKKKQRTVDQIVPLIQTEVINNDKASYNTFSRSLTRSRCLSSNNTKGESISGRLNSKSNDNTSKSESFLIRSQKDSLVTPIKNKTIQLYRTMS